MGHIVFNPTIPEKFNSSVGRPLSKTGLMNFLVCWTQELLAGLNCNTDIHMLRACLHTFTWCTHTCIVTLLTCIYKTICQLFPTDLTLPRMFRYLTRNQQMETGTYLPSMGRWLSLLWKLPGKKHFSFCKIDNENSIFLYRISLIPFV